ncbi:RNA polymerase sigma-70 factor [Vulcaniibacterium tengchongense]|uniref:RNA polymerase sigma-70 factor (ECF subfamily) n=1 Tax=Vulcaniibacterium tengchongense TaxID=1273429 RepID=A0A3N4VRG1_9GAMM|nr:RNA polymerase sigma-70 factor [Vulcaniibacterium tengchongense]RPE81801.1 RNA polymerase sigma-70 factor (ECF subfamily) [Vulcaniibacterium tengchongense]
MTTDPLFETHRPRLFALAYRLLGSRSDAEDVVQDAWLRWRQADPAEIRDPEAWLVTAATRLGIDRLRRVRHERETYTGPWLPEPLEVDEAPGPERGAEIAQQVSLAFLALLERLGPEERAAFLLKEAFDYDYAQIAELLGHSEANCRQMVHRARLRLQAERPRFAVEPDRHRRLLERFMHAARAGDRDAIAALLADNARLVSDGGGKAVAARRPLFGAERIARLYWAVARRPGPKAEWRLGRVNGEPAILRWLDGRLHSITTVTIEDDRIVEVLSVMNPDKLRGLA